MEAHYSRMVRFQLQNMLLRLSLMMAIARNQEIITLEINYAYH